jgi:DNA-directed RNA polymerase specialized sigma24 family protein
MVLLRDEQCEDVVAEVFVGLWFFPETLDPTRGSLLAFLRLKARSRSIDLVRAEISRRRREVTQSRAMVGGEEDPGRLIVASGQALAIRIALAQLPATPVPRDRGSGCAAQRNGSAWAGNGFFEMPCSVFQLAADAHTG